MAAQRLTKQARASKKGNEEPVLELGHVKEWQRWLTAHHASSQGVWLRLSKRGAEKTLTYPEALDAALAWGWIDSQKRALDASAWLQRFTPRTAKSPWSKINCAKVEALISAGTMQAPGLAHVERAKRDGRWDAAYTGARASTVPADLAQALARSARARAFFEQLDGANRYAILYRVQTAKKPETRAERIARFVEMCAQHQTLHAPRPSKANKASKASKASKANASTAKAKPRKRAVTKKE